ncbi:folate family ECF transporter S component [Anaerovorax sp. IOR16]|uniref:folate family ECF transporter S component n=1 Tax=Anaerovorax sp. IOR16 TaxID=2773458 RepID=UPI0019D2E606|nr:folate family ECF transporter S component [Anaerovorax sp. IOR16]
MKKKLTTKNLLLITLFATISIVLTRFLAFYLPFLGFNSVRISLGNIPLMLAGFLLGPLSGAITGILSDLIGATLFPAGPYFPGFTLTACLTGFLPGLLKSIIGGQMKWKNVLLITLLTEGVCSIGLNTLWLSILFGTSYLALLFPRVPVTILMTIVYSLLVTILYHRLRKEIYY